MTTPTQQETGIPDGPLLCVKELADVLPWSESTIYAMRKSGAPFWGYFSTEADLLRWMKGHPEWSIRHAYPRTPDAN